MEGICLLLASVLTSSAYALPVQTASLRLQVSAVGELEQHKVDSIGLACRWDLTWWDGELEEVQWPLLPCIRSGQAQSRRS